MGPVLCQCARKKRLAKLKVEWAKFKPPMPTGLTEIEINAFAFAGTLESTRIINRGYRTDDPRAN